jgi:hypothetical protein
VTTATAFEQAFAVKSTTIYEQGAQQAFLGRG